MVLAIQMAVAVAFASAVGRLTRHWIEARMHHWDVRRQVRRNYRIMAGQ